MSGSGDTKFPAQLYLFSDVVKTGVRALSCESFLGHLENPLAVPRRVSASLAWGGFGRFVGISKSQN